MFPRKPLLHSQSVLCGGIEHEVDDARCLSVAQELLTTLASPHNSGQNMVLIEGGMTIVVDCGIVRDD